MDKPPSTELPFLAASLSRRWLMQSAAAMGAVGAAGWIVSGSAHAKEKDMLLATTKVENFDRFLKIFSTKGAEKRKQHGSKGCTVFRDPTEETASGCSSTGTRRAGRASSRIPRSPRS